MAPSKQWRERIAPDEPQRYDIYAKAFVEMQRRKSKAHGPGRALHRKGLIGLRARFEVLPDLPEAARHGLFATPGEHEAWVRLSNGSAMRQADKTADIRGFAIKVFGVEGGSALGQGAAQTQDFLLINRSVFGFPTSEDFVGLAIAAGNGGLTLIRYLVTRYGVIGAFRFIAEFSKGLRAPFKGFASQAFFSATPIACGPYACRVRLAPLGNPEAAATTDWRGDVVSRLAAGPLRFDFQLQFFVDEASTPIEDASVDWLESVAPYATVGRLTIAPQDVTPELEAEVERAAFDPWSALIDHRPLGDVMRARKVAYYASERERGAV